MADRIAAVLTLMSDELAPTTSAIGFLRLPHEAAVDALVTWRKQLYGRVKARELSGDLRTFVTALEPLTTGALPREILVSTKGDEWTAYFNCGVHGTDPIGPVGHLTWTVGCAGVAVHSVPHTMSTAMEKPGRYGAVHFELFGPDQTEFLNYVRTVAVSQDGTSRWRFDVNGTVQEFEQADRYQARRVRDRFDSKLLADYCSALGIQVFDSAFYGPTATLVKSPIRPPWGALKMTLAQAQAHHGIVPGVADQLPG